MKKIKVFALFILCLVVTFSTQVHASEQSENEVIEQQASSVTVVSLETKEVLFKITTNIDDVDVLTNEAVKMLKDNMLKDNIDSDILVNATFCCVPNAPYRNIEIHYHIVLGNGYCKRYYQTARQCLNCGEVYNFSAEKNVNQHKTTFACP